MIEEEKVDRVKNLYRMICAQKIENGEEARATVRELEKLVGHDFRNTQEFHYYVSDFIKRKDRCGETVGRRIFRARRRLKLTQTQLAEKLGATRMSIVRWETDAQPPSQKALEWLSLADPGYDTAKTTRSEALGSTISESASPGGKCNNFGGGRYPPTGPPFFRHVFPLEM